jgi:hypothetical protein
MDVVRRRLYPPKVSCILHNNARSDELSIAILQYNPPANSSNATVIDVLTVLVVALSLTVFVLSLIYFS